MPRFAAAQPGCPRLLALDEAFAGIDDLGRAELLSLTVAFDLDLFMTGFDLWATQSALAGVAHHDLLHLPAEHAVSSLLVLWNGRELVEGPDAEAQLVLGSVGGGSGSSGRSGVRGRLLHREQPCTGDLVRG